MESSHVPLTKWALAYRLHDVRQERHFSSPTSPDTWRIIQDGVVHGASHPRSYAPDRRWNRWAAKASSVEADETFVGGKAKNRAYAKTLPTPRSCHVASRTRRESPLPPCCRRYGKDAETDLSRSDCQGTAHFRTDQAPVYTEIGTGFASHETVNHSIKEYVRGDAHTNTVEGYFSIFKRGIYGTYHHVSAATPEAVSVRIRLPLQ